MSIVLVELSIISLGLQWLLKLVILTGHVSNYIIKYKIDIRHLPYLQKREHCPVQAMAHLTGTHERPTFTTWYKLIVIFWYVIKFNMPINQKMLSYIERTKKECKIRPFSQKSSAPKLKVNSQVWGYVKSYPKLRFSW